MALRVYGATIVTNSTRTDGQRNIIASTTSPASTDGLEGDIWLTYTA